MDMQLTHVAYGGCWKCPQLWQRCSFNTPCFAASQKGFVHSFGTGIGRVTLVQSLMVVISSCGAGNLVHTGERGKRFPHPGRSAAGLFHSVPLSLIPYEPKDGGIMPGQTIKNEADFQSRDVDTGARL